MSPEELIVALFEMFAEHVKMPEGYDWVPAATSAGIAVAGLILLLRGARWAPGFAALSFLLIGGGLGAFLGDIIALPMWLTGGIGGVLGLVLGVVMFRLWQATLLASCCVILGLSVYFVRTLHVEVQNWISGPTEAEFITLQPAGSVVGEQTSSVQAEFQSLWQHLSDNVPNFQMTFWSLLISTGLAGLIFGLFLPRASRALWAASLGTITFGIGLTALLEHFAPDALDWLLANTMWAWCIVGGVWLISLGINYATCGKRKSDKRSAKNKDEAEGEPAVA